MKDTVEDNLEGKGEKKLELYRVTIQDCRHIFNTYKDTHPDDAWDCLKKLIFNKHLK